MSAFDDDPITLPLNVKLSTVTVPANEVVPLTVTLPVVVKFDPTSKVEESVTAPETDAVPSTTNPSLMLIVLESADEIVVPLIVMLDPIIVLPVPPGVILISAFEDDVMLLS